MDDFTPDSELEEEYSVIGRELTTFVLQPAFVESILPEQKTLHSIAEAFRFIFRNNKEFGIFLWNGIPVKFSYESDLPLMIEPLIGLLSNIHSEKQVARFVTPALSFEWSVTSNDADQLTIRQTCQHVNGGYKQILNQLGIIIIHRNDFLNEWKLLLNQLVEAFDRSELQLTEPRDQELLQRLRLLNTNIEGPGSLYSYDKT